MALRRLRPAQFGVLMSLEPAAAALAGLLVVGERLSLVQLLAIGCVVVASVGATRSASSTGLSRADSSPAPWLSLALRIISPICNALLM